MHATLNCQDIGRHITEALQKGATTRQVVVGAGALDAIVDCFYDCFGRVPAVVVADENTYQAAGERVAHQFSTATHQNVKPFVFDDANLYAEYAHMERLREFLAQSNAVAIAVGSGTINDLVKLASGECGRPYMSVGTAASMDGYTSFGASVMRNGHKQTLPCPAPLAVVIDLDVIAAAPPRLNAAGYADLLAKVPAGADWLIADALRIEPINLHAWSLVQDRLREWISDPEGVRRGDRRALVGLMEGLIMTGLAMQYCGTTRPASGAEHQFSHLWDMQHHTHDGSVPLHGEKVGIGSIAVAAVYERVLQQDAETINLDADTIRRSWPTWDDIEADTRRSYSDPLLAEEIVGQQRAKYIDFDELRARRTRLRECWEDLRTKLQQHLLTADQTRELLQKVGAPYHPEQIGISRERLHESYRLAQQIRSRYTVLDLVFQTGWWGDCVDGLFGAGSFCK